jgi:hypothetical protein
MASAATMTSRSPLVFGKADPLREILPEKAVGILVGFTVVRGLGPRLKVVCVDLAVEHQAGCNIKKLAGQRPHVRADA